MFCRGAENLLHGKKKNLLAVLIYCMCHQTYTTPAKYGIMTQFLIEQF